MSFNAIVVALALVAVAPVYSQVAPAATEGGLRLKVGAGFSDYLGDLSNGRLLGGTLWVDCNPAQLPPELHGWGLEAEGRGVHVGATSPAELGTFRQSTVGGGPIYTWIHYRNFRPYAKFLTDFAGQDFNVGVATYHHETQVAFAPGGGIEYRAYRHIWARLDYEYQIWPKPFSNPNWYLDPQGITVGAAWDLGSLLRH
jgi:outer membrane protein with beta-barrel domain